MRISHQPRRTPNSSSQLTFLALLLSKESTSRELRMARLRITDQMLERNRSGGIETPRLNDARNPHAPLGGVGV